APHRRGDPRPGLSDRADESRACRRHAGDAQPRRRPHLRVARPADPLSMNVIAAPVAEVEAAVEINRLRALWSTMRRKPLGAVSAALIVTIVLSALFANVLAPYDPLD